MKHPELAHAGIGEPLAVTGAARVSAGIFQFQSPVLGERMVNKPLILKIMRQYAADVSSRAQSRVRFPALTVLARQQTTISQRDIACGQSDHERLPPLFVELEAPPMPIEMLTY